MDAQTTEATVGFVLVHGSELGSWLWDPVRPLLERPTVAADLPGRSSRPGEARTVTLDAAVAALVEDVGRCGTDRVILVAHSFSGVLVPPVVDRVPDRIAAVVFVGATVPEEGRSWADLQPAAQRLALRLLYRLRPDGMLSPAGQNRKQLCNDLDEDTTEWFLEHRVPEAPGLLLDAVSPAALPSELPCHYVRLARDQSTTIAARDRSIDRLENVTVHDLDTGHLPMLSQPASLAALLERIAASCQDGAGS